MRDLPKSAPPNDVLRALQTASDRWGVPLLLLVGVAWVESRFNPLAGPSSTGAQGLMQLMPDTARSLNANAWDPNDAADAAARFLAAMHKKFGTWERALAGYNWGPGHVSRRPDISTWPASVQRYVLSVWEAGRAAPLPFNGPIYLVQSKKGGGLSG